MTDKKLKVYFLGSGRIAVPSLQALSEDSRIELCGIGTQPDKPKGRKKQLHPTPVGEWAAEKSLNIDKPHSVNTDEFIEKMNELKPDVILVIAFGQLLKETLLNLPKLGCINVHASILPEFRGASPIASVILSGDTKTGVSIMQMEKGLDSGPVFSIETVDIADEDTAWTLEDKLAEKAAACLADTVLKISAGELTAQIQDHDQATHVTKISREDARIDWQLSASTLVRRLRAFTPWPGAFFSVATKKGPKRVQVTAAQTFESDEETVPGTVIDAGKKKIVIACGENTFLELLRVVPEGKKEMSATDFRNGGLVSPGLVVQ